MSDCIDSDFGSELIDSEGKASDWIDSEGRVSVSIASDWEVSGLIGSFVGRELPDSGSWIEYFSQ